MSGSFSGGSHKGLVKMTSTCSSKTQGISVKSDRGCPLMCPLWQVVLVAVAGLLVSVEQCHAADPCDSGWFYNETEGVGKCYYFSNLERSFNDSARRCQDEEAQLASLATKGETDFIRYLFEKGKVANTAKFYWLGMYREDVRSSNLMRGWVWLDGTDFTWMNWSPGEPDPSERCARLRTFGPYEWFGRECSTTYGRICEKPSRTMATSSSTKTTTATAAAATTTGTPTTTIRIKTEAISSLILDRQTTSIFTSTSTKQCGCCECDCPENKTKAGNSVLIAVAVIGWSLSIVVIIIAAVLFCNLKRRPKLQELDSNKYAQGPEPDYEQVGLPAVIEASREAKRPGVKVAAGPGGIGHDLPQDNAGDTWNRSVAEYENQPDTSVIQYENTRLASRNDPSPKDDEQDMNTAKYESLQGNDRPTWPNPTYTELAVHSNVE